MGVFAVTFAGGGQATFLAANPNTKAQASAINQTFFILSTGKSSICQNVAKR
jgi:hypothetical protein